MDLFNRDTAATYGPPPDEPLREQEAVVRAELEPGEKLLWSGKSGISTGQAIRKSFPIMLFAIPWTAFAIFWICAASGFRLPDLDNLHPANLFPLFGIPFVLVGLGMLATPFRLVRKARKIVYAVTDRRCLIIEAGRARRIRSYAGKDIGQVERTEYADGSGDLVIGGAGSGGLNAVGAGAPGIPNKFRRNGDGETLRFVFEKIANVREVERTINRHLGEESR